MKKLNNNQMTIRTAMALLLAAAGATAAPHQMSHQGTTGHGTRIRRCMSLRTLRRIQLRVDTAFDTACDASLDTPCEPTQRLIQHRTRRRI